MAKTARRLSLVCQHPVARPPPLCPPWCSYKKRKQPSDPTKEGSIVNTIAHDVARTKILHPLFGSGGQGLAMLKRVLVRCAELGAVKEAGYIQVRVGHPRLDGVGFYALEYLVLSLSLCGDGVAEGGPWSVVDSPWGGSFVHRKRRIVVGGAVLSRVNGGRFYRSHAVGS